MCFLYAFAKAYAAAMGCELQVPSDWIGRKIFVNTTEPPISHPHLRQTPLDARMTHGLGLWFGLRDVDLFSYCQHQVFVDWYSRADVREWLKLKPEFDSHQSNPVKPYSAAHLRRGDYQTKYADRYCIVSDSSYDKAIDQFNIPQPIYPVQEGWRHQPAVLVEQGLGWLDDFLLLRDATHLLRANSSFSWWAATLGHGKVYSPVVENKVGWQDCEFVEGNWPCTAGRFHNQSDLHLKEE